MGCGGGRGGAGQHWLVVREMAMLSNATSLPWPLCTALLKACLLLLLQCTSRSTSTAPEPLHLPLPSMCMRSACPFSLSPHMCERFQGVARSMPTSSALDMVAASLKLPFLQTPTGWKLFW